MRTHSGWSAGKSAAGLAVGILAFAATVALAVGCSADEPSADLDARRADVAEAGAMVMPFDLDASTHIFEKTEVGGVQQVVSDNGDPEQVALIRDHLAEEAAKFAEGDFHDPQMIHGDDMPGIHALVMGHERITIEYSEIENGAQVLYTTEDAALVEAIHAWFDAQLSDHGEHAQPHH